MNSFFRRVGYNGRLFFCFQTIEKFIKKWYNHENGYCYDKQIKFITATKRKESNYG